MLFRSVRPVRCGAVLWRQHDHPGDFRAVGGGRPGARVRRPGEMGRAHRPGRTHIPAGLGVLEAVFIGLLQHEASRGSLLGGLIAYRAIYFILPLLIALVMYLGVEAKAKSLRVKKAPV